MKVIIKTVTAVVLSLAVILAPVGAVLGISFLAPSQYSNTFYGALDAKYQRLTSLEQDKIVVVGGSSVAFGLDSALLEEYMGMPVVNFGLYADLGTRLMLELSRDHIGEGDIVIIAPELDAQTLSMYFSWENTLKAFDDDMSMLGELDRSVDEWLFSINGFWQLASAKLKYMIRGEKPNPDDVYNANNFNEYGDIDKTKFPRENNIMKSHYLTGANYAVDLDPSIVEPEFLEYLNAYIKECKEKGATVYFTWCPVNDLSVTDLSDERIDGFESFFKENLECEVIGELDGFIIDSHYFYDTNLHLNDAGVTLRTVRLLQCLAQKYPSMDTESLEGVQIPEPPEYKYSADYDGEDPNEIYFEYEIVNNGTYKITGLSSLGQRQSTLTVPLGYDGKIVTEIDLGIFESGKCEKLILPEGTNIVSMKGSPKGLKNIYIYSTDHNSITPPESLSGISSDFRIHVPKGSGYDASYNWASADNMGILVDDL